MITSGEIPVVKPEYFLPAANSDERRAMDFNAYPVTPDQSFPAVAHFPAVAAAADQPTIHGWEYDSGPLTTGTQFIAPFASAKEVDSILLPLPLPSRPVARSLWSYSEKMPAVKVRISSSQQVEQKQPEKANFLL